MSGRMVLDAYLALERRFSAGMASWDSSWVDAGTLHKELKAGKAFTNWIKGRINRYEFVGNEDYKPDSPKRVNQNSHGGDRKSKICSLTLDMAEELSMAENNKIEREM